MRIGVECESEPWLDAGAKCTGGWEQPRTVDLPEGGQAVDGRQLAVVENLTVARDLLEREEAGDGLQRVVVVDDEALAGVVVEADKREGGEVVGRNRR